MARYFYPNPRLTVESARRIELSWLLRNNYLSGQKSGNIIWSINGKPTGNINIEVSVRLNSPYIKFSYKARNYGAEEWVDIDYEFQLESISCHFGGKKWFFRCGLVKKGIFCGKRARVLYSIGNYFGCRRCADLSYESCNESKLGRYGYLNLLDRSWKAEDFLSSLKRKRYKDKPTRKYRKYLKMANFDEVEVKNALTRLDNLLCKYKQKEL